MQTKDKANNEFGMLDKDVKDVAKLGKKLKQ